MPDPETPAPSAPLVPSADPGEPAPGTPETERQSAVARAMKMAQDAVAWSLRSMANPPGSPKPAPAAASLGDPTTEERSPSEGDPGFGRGMQHAEDTVAAAVQAMAVVTRR